MEDRISKLPNEVLVRILSRLSLKEAVASSILSRRWRYVWKSTLKLNFDPLDIVYNLRSIYPLHTGKFERMKYMNWVDSVLKKHIGPKINHFRVCFHLENELRFHIDSWIKFAMEKKVENLELDFLIFADHGCPVPFYNFPSTLVKFEALQVLDFKSVNISGKVIEHLLANCPLLERLIVWESYKLLDVRVYSPVLKHLEIRQCGEIKSIEVSTANLVSFYFDGYGRFSLQLKNVPKLVEVSVSWYICEDLINSAFNLLSCCLSQLQVLKMDIGSEKFKNNQVIPTSTNLKLLHLEVDVAQICCLLQLNSFLQAFPNLQKLVLVLWQEFMMEYKKFIKAAKCCHYYLKEVEILGYSGGERVDDFIMHVIKNAVKLEKIVIDPRRYRPYPMPFPFPGDIEVETNSRIHAIEKLKPKVPSNIEFVCYEVIGHSKTKENRISELPDEIIADILSRLSLKEAVASSILSHRWRYVWKSTLKLNFDPIDIIHNLRAIYPLHTGKFERMKYMNWVDSVLKKHIGPKIDHFRICFHLENELRFHIDNWIKFAIGKKVKNLELDFLIFADHGCTVPFYNFPPSLVFDNNIGFESLQVLDFKSVNISGEVIEHLLSNCPLLERLIVWESYELWDVRVSSPVLKHLEIRQCGKIKSIEVSTSKLVSFYFDGYGIFSLLLKYVPKLVDVSISWYICEDLINSAFNMLSCCLSQLEILKIEIGSEKFNNQVIPTSTNLKHLHLEIDVAQSCCLLQLNSFLKAFPNLQKLVLVLWEEYMEEYKNIRKAAKCGHYHLKEVEILGYYGGKIVDDFIVHVVKNAVTLEKIVIDPHRYRPYPMAFPFPGDIEVETNGRIHAMQKLKPKVPSTIEFVCL